MQSTSAPLLPPDFALLTAITLENVVRLEVLLKRQQLASANRPEYQAILAKMLKLCSDYQRNFFENAAIFRKALQGDKLSRIDELAVRSLLRNAAGTFLVAHELAVFLPRESVRGEMLSFCRCLFRREFDLHRISILLTSIFNAFEYSLDDALVGLNIEVLRAKTPKPNDQTQKDLPFGHVMEVAMVDRDNPLSWPILAHEFGHYIDHNARLSERLTAEYLKAEWPVPASSEVQDTFEKICAEIIADLSAYYFLGPCSVAPLLTMSLLSGLPRRYPLEFDGVHPLATARVQILEGIDAQKELPMDGFKPLIDALVTEERLAQARLTPEARKLVDDVHADAGALARCINSSMTDELAKHGFQRFAAANLAKAVELEGRLAQGLPIGAARKATDAQIQTAMLQLTDKSGEEAFRHTYGLLRDCPTHPGEVLTAGWFYKVKRLRSVVLGAFDARTEEGLFDTVRSFVEDTDKSS